MYEYISSDPSSQHFKVLPDPFLYPSYYAVITKPICLADINNLIGAGKYSLDDMQRDLRRMIGNAKKFNMPESQVYQDALQLERVIRKSVKDIQKEGEAFDDEDAM